MPRRFALTWCVRICVAGTMMSFSLVPVRSETLLSRSTPAALGKGDMDKFHVFRNQGLLLRGAIDRRYEYLQRGNKLKMFGDGANDIGDLVDLYIPKGTSLADALRILEGAGFTPEETPNRFIPRSSARYVAIDNYRQRSFPLGRVSIRVTLVPSEESDRVVVKYLSSTIFSPIS